MTKKLALLAASAAIVGALAAPASAANPVDATPAKTEAVGQDGHYYYYYYTYRRPVCYVQYRYVYTGYGYAYAWRRICY
jgi:hypothetical protein